MNIKLFEWQKECLNKWEQNNCHGIVNVVTGAGKTILALSAIEKTAEKSKGCFSVKIIVPTYSLVAQWRNAIRQYLPELSMKEPGQIGIYSGERKDNPGHRFMIYVINSARHSVSSHILKDIREGRTVLMICDECHHYGSTENRKIFHHNASDCLTLGLSATPMCEHFQDVLVPALGREIYKYDFRDATLSGNISEYRLIQVGCNFSGKEGEEYYDICDRINMLHGRLLHTYGFLKGLSDHEFFNAVKAIASGDSESPAAAYLMLSYKRQMLSNMAENRIKCVCDLVKTVTAQRIIIFCERIAQADRMMKEINERLPYSARCYHSSKSQTARKQALSDFRDGVFRILITCRALDEGIDVPEVSVGIVLSCSGARRQRIQRLGRILRKSSDKKLATMYFLYIKNADSPAYLPDDDSALSISNMYYTNIDGRSELRKV